MAGFADNKSACDCGAKRFDLRVEEEIGEKQVEVEWLTRF
jgi:hypothetical protein